MDEKQMLEAKLIEELPSSLIVVVQDWEESERGWGTRPDGISIHLTEEDRSAYCENYWREERKRNAGGGTPDEYEREAGRPWKAEITDLEAIKLVTQHRSQRIYKGWEMYKRLADGALKKVGVLR